MIATSVTPGIALTCAMLLTAERAAVDRRRPADHRRQRARDVEIHRELLRAGHDLAAASIRGCGVPISV